MQMTQYQYTSVMSLCEYDYEAKLWTLPGRCFVGMEEDSVLLFNTKYEAHTFVIDNWYKKF